MAVGEVQLEQLKKQFGDVVAVDSVDLHMPPGEFFTLLGPSGCGKTTTLRMISGFERPTSGRILLDGSDVARVPPHKRNVNTVFQSYALFPHLDVAGNVAFGLKYLRVPKEEGRRRVAEVLDRVRLTGFAHRKPSQLSGGQQQRVALARALILAPRVLLLDEPLGALDARLRKELQVELKALQADIGVTFVFVTHDQEEALTMSDRVAVMRDGRVEQAGSPEEVYEEPSTSFVADFLGVSNLLEVDARDGGSDDCVVRLADRALVAGSGETGARGPLKVMIRPERIRLEPQDSAGENRLPGMIERHFFRGGVYEVHVRVIGGELLRVTMANEGDASTWAREPGTPVTLHLPREALRVLRPDDVEEEDAEPTEAAAPQPA
jgi:spermidine/putrescine transport system ATP-binding protein